MLEPLSSRFSPPLLSPNKPAAAVPAGPSTKAAAGNPFATKVGEAARQLSEAAPVNAARVAELRKALQASNYPVQPERLADAMLASLKS